MKCVFCGNKESKVVDSRYLKDSTIRRRRECLKCGKRFTTHEVFESNPMIVTNADNMREPFNSEKLRDSLKYACYCTSIEENVNTLSAEVESKLLLLQQQEISTADIVNVALEVLMQYDAMACLVYYSQHTSSSTFDDIRQFLNK